MSTEHFAQFFPAICAGLGLFLVGCVNLVLLQRSLRVRFVSTLIALSIATGVAATIDSPDVLPRTLQILAVGLIPCLFLSSRWCVSSTATLITASHRPVARFGMLTLAGLGTAIGSVIVFERADNKATEDSLADLGVFESNSPSIPSNRARGVTDRGTMVVLKEPASAREDVLLTAGEEKFLASSHLKDQIIRQGAGSDQSNCHGWVFAAGRFRLGPDDVQLILSENGYQEVSEPRPGDVVVYRMNGNIAHTAVVRYVTEGQPVLVEGKWGAIGIFLHAIDKSVYGTDYKFFRSQRRGHLLVGLTGQITTGD